ncbi:MAG: UDP-3-O-(3-hydroxymyristoyl)glucosamine N-acyltransferase [Verrucomicrobiota bacterium]
MAFSFSLESIFRVLGDAVRTQGDYRGQVTGISSLSAAEGGDLSFLGNPKYRSEVPASKASVLLLPADYEGVPVENQLFIHLESPSFALALICHEIERMIMPQPEPGVHPSAVIHPDAKISEEASIGPLCVVGAGAVVGAAFLESHVCIGNKAKIGDGSYLFSGVSVGAYCEIGPRNRLQSGCVIGSDGYGYEYMDGQHQRVPQIGNVVTAEAVDIGANTTVDRARFGSTYIGAGSKIDNLVQIAHNVQIGQNCLVVSQVGISGSSELGNGVVLGGQAGVVGHIKIGAGAMISAQSGVSKSVEPGAKLRGAPAMDMALAGRLIVLQRKLPNLFKRFDQLEKSIEAQLNKSTNDD